MIFDTNVLIYLSKYILQPENLFLDRARISVITKIETLGYAFKNIEEYKLLANICDALPIITLTDSIVDETIRLRRDYRIKLPDAVIYATALTENVPLLTHNIADFISLDGKVELIDPFKL